MTATTPQRSVISDQDAVASEADDRAHDGAMHIRRNRTSRLRDAETRRRAEERLREQRCETGRGSD